MVPLLRTEGKSKSKGALIGFQIPLELEGGKGRKYDNIKK